MQITPALTRFKITGDKTRRAATVNKITIPGLIINHLATLYRYTPIVNELCTWIAKTTPYPSCHRDNIPAKVPGSGIGWLRRVTLTNYYRRAVSKNAPAPLNWPRAVP